MRNLVVRRPGTGGGEGAPAVVIQGHVDIVCEKNSDTVHDFFTDPLKLRTDGPWLKATGTTLGSDNGIGVATALALLDLPATQKLPPLECLFTVDEETGLTGAFELDASMLTGRTMLNLDTEEWGALYVGCAGGGDSTLTLARDLEPAPAGLEALELRLTGLMGGHSGCNIHEYRGNGVIMGARVVKKLLGELGADALHLASFRGGDKRNAIPREAFATVLVAPARRAAAEAVVAAELAALKLEYGAKEANLKLDLAAADATPEQCLGQGAAQALLDLVTALPNGPQKFSHAVEGLVETSTNVASVKLAGDDLAVTCSTRSSLQVPLENVRDQIRTLATLCGAKAVVQDEAYPGWAPNLDSEVLGVAKDVLGEVLGKEPEVLAIHAGLECG